MVSEAQHWGGNVEKHTIRAQERSMRLDEVARGYTVQVKEVMSGPAAPAIRNEVKKYADLIAATDGMEQYQYLSELGERLAPYKSFFGGVWEDKDERPALALAFVRYEKSLQ